MVRKSQWIAALSVCAWCTAAIGQTAPTTQDTQQLLERIATLEGQMSQMRAAQGETWLNERRAEEVRQLIREVLSDADTRASMMADGMTAGHDPKNGFFLSSNDGTFLLQLSGQIQLRYILNNRNRNDSPGDFDDTESGFQMRRVKVGFAGHIGDPRLEYNILFNANRDDGDVELEDAWIGYKFTDSFKIWAGRFMNRYSREQIMSSRRQLAVDRSIVANVFAGNDGYVEGVAMEWVVDPDFLKASLTINDGLNSGAQGGAGGGFQNRGNDFHNDASDIAFTGRLDFKLAGDWSQTADASSWSNANGLHAFIGAAAHYELGESGDGEASATTAQTGPYDSFLQWTVDALVKTSGLGVMAAFHGWHFDDASSNPAAIGNTDHYGATVQVAYMVVPDKLEPFVRFEWIEVDDSVPMVGDEILHALTAGFNWYHAKHSAKFTTDVTWIPDTLNAANTMGIGLNGIGVLSDDGEEEDQLIWRIQYQLLF